jgi:hypothetical protein
MENMTGKRLLRSSALVGLSLALCPIANGVQADSTRRPTAPVASSQSLAVGKSTLQVDFAEGPLDLAKDQIAHRIQVAANAVIVYYGQFPVSRVRILVIPVAGRHGVLQGTTWGNRDGFPAFLRLRIGQSTTASELSADWIITHELVHTALPSLPDDQHWLEEGLASYVEPVARVQAGELTPQVIWGDMMHGMPNGEPALEDHGLNNTHTWGRTYWGGALFCMMADIQIRKQTGNRLGLQDSLRAIVAAGGTIDKEWPLARILTIGDQATGTRVLEEMYARWGETPVPVNLAEVWSQLGVQAGQSTITFDSKAPLAPVRLAITDLPKSSIIR